MIPFLDLQAANAAMRDELIEACTRVIDSGWYILGEELNAFEAEFAAYCGTKHCIGVANGLDALTLTLRALGPARLVSTPSAPNASPAGLARDCRQPGWTVSPNLSGFHPTVSGQGGKSTKGVLYH